MLNLSDKPDINAHTDVPLADSTEEPRCLVLFNQANEISGDNVENTKKRSDLLRDAFSKCTPDHKDHYEKIIENFMDSFDISAFENVDSFEKNAFNDMVKLMRAAVDLATPAERPDILPILAEAHQLKAGQLHDKSAYHEAVRIYKEVISLLPDPSTKRAEAIVKTCEILQEQYRYFSDLSTLNEAIILAQEVVDKYPSHTHQPDRASSLIGVLLYLRYLHSPNNGNVEDLKQSIKYHKAALDSLPADQPEAAEELLVHLAYTINLYTRRTGDQQYVSDTIDVLRGIQLSTSLETAAKISNLINLSALLLIPGDTQSTDEAVESYLQALRPQEQSGDEATSELAEDPFLLQCTLIADVPIDHSSYLECASLLTKCIHKRYEKFKTFEELSRIICAAEENSPTTASQSDTGRATSSDLHSLLISLALALALSKATENSSDSSRVEHAISLLKQVEDKSKHCEPFKSQYTSAVHRALGRAFKVRFDQSNSLDDLNDSIWNFREARRHCPKTDPTYPYILNNLSDSLVIRCRLHSNDDDRIECVLLSGEITETANDNVILNISAIHNVADLYYAQYEIDDEPGTLSDAIETYSTALDSVDENEVSSDYPEYPNLLYSTANTLVGQFERSKDVNALEKAGSYLETLLDSELTQELATLTMCLVGTVRYLQYISSGSPKEYTLLSAALKIHNEAMNQLRQDVRHASLLPSYGQILHCQALDHSARYMEHHDRADFDLAMGLFSQAVQVLSLGFKKRFSISRDWIRCASEATERVGDPSFLLTAYDQALQLLPRLITFTQHVKIRLMALRRSVSLASEAAVCALKFGKVEKALEWLEHGRGIFWGQLSQLRDPLENIPDEISDRLTAITRELEAGGYSRGNLVDKFLESDDQSWYSAGNEDENEKATHAKYKLADEFEELVKKVRTTVPGMEHFLELPSAANLLEAGKEGPVVIFAAGHYGVKAIILRPDGEPEVVDLGTDTQPLTLDSLKGAAKEAVDLLRCNNRNVLNTRLLEHLDWLWGHIMEPVLVKSLHLQSTSRNRPRIWLCPTGPFCFLPLHAALSFDNSNDFSLTHATMSYVPTLGILIKARKRFQKRPIDSVNSLKFLLLAQPNSRIDKKLPLAGTEITKLKTAIDAASKDSSFIYLDGQSLDVTGEQTDVENVKRVLQQDPGPSVLHLACHGKQVQNDPIHSGFAMLDGRLEVSDLTKMKMGQAFLAVLSACESAKGDFEQPDEVIHLAATILFIGFNSVLGTMWEISDGAALRVSEAVYKALLNSFSSGHFEPKVIPDALQDTLINLKKQQVKSFIWAPFIHIGI